MTNTQPLSHTAMMREYAIDATIGTFDSKDGDSTTIRDRDDDGRAIIITEFALYVIFIGGRLMLATVTVSPFNGEDSHNFTLNLI